MSGLSGVGSSTSSSSTTSGTLGTAPPISFPGIASGIDYNAIIEKLTSLTLAQNQPLEAENTNLQKQNTELAKINGLIQQVQTAIQNLGAQTLFQQFSATSSNTAFGTALQTAGSTPTAGTTTILSQTLATSTTINGDPGANQHINVNNPLEGTASNAGFQITPTNGTGSTGGKFTVNGQQISYDVGSSTVTTILGELNNLTGVSASYDATTDTFTITSTNGQPLSLGSAGDAGNLEQIMKLDDAQITTGQTSSSQVGGGVTAGEQLSSIDTTDAPGTYSFTINGHTINYTIGTDTVQTLIDNINNSGAGVSASLNASGQIVLTSTSGALTVAGDTGNLVTSLNLTAATASQSITSAGGVGGIDPDVSLNTVNSTTALNSGTLFTINGVAININPATDNLQDVINDINSSNAGVTASWNTTLGELQLVAKATGPQSIVLGSPSDTSNFLQAFGLTTAGATTQTGTQASLTYQSPAGVPTTVYSSSNQFTNVIPGVTLTIQQTDSGPSATPYTVTVAQSNSNLISAINAFVKAYNAAIQEINTATAPPVVQTAAPGTPLQSGAASSSVTVPGGVLFGNSTVENMKDQLVDMVSGLVQTGSTSYNSFASIGLQLDSSFTQITSTSTAGSSDSKDSTDSAGGLQEQTVQGTSGQLQALDTTTLDAALAADPTAVQSLFTGSQGVLAQLGTYMTYVTGTPTSLGPDSAFLAQVPDVSLLQSIEDSNSQQIDSINAQIDQVNDMATAQANQLRAQFTASETLIAQLQQEQQSLSSILGSSTSSSSSSS